MVMKKKTGEKIKVVCRKEYKTIGEAIWDFIEQSGIKQQE